MKDGQGIGRYIGRYLRHPAIANERIKGYEEQEVIISYDKGKKGKRRQVKKRLPVGGYGAILSKSALARQDDNHRWLGMAVGQRLFDRFNPQRS